VREREGRGRNGKGEEGQKAGKGEGRFNKAADWLRPALDGSAAGGGVAGAWRRWRPTS